MIKRDEDAKRKRHVRACVSLCSLVHVTLCMCMCEFVLAADSILGAEAYIQTGDPLNYRQLPIVALVSDSSLLMDGIC